VFAKEGHNRTENACCCSNARSTWRMGDALRLSLERQTLSAKEKRSAGECHGSGAPPDAEGKD